MVKGYCSFCRLTMLYLHIVSRNCRHLCKMTDGDVVGLLMEAINFAAIKHRDQRRKDVHKTPYINHPVGVAYLLWKEGGVTDASVLQAAFLHDTVEDTDTSFEELERVFGADVRNLVAEVSDDKSLPKLERKRLQIENASKKSPRARLVSYGDKLYNLRDLNKCTPEGWSEVRVQEYFDWSGSVLRNMLGANDKLEAALEQVLQTKGVTLYQ